MDKETVKEGFIGLMEDVKKIKNFLFSEQKPEAPAEPAKEEAKEEVKEDPVVAKVEFNAEEFTKGYNEFKTSIEAQIKTSEEKFAAFEAQIAKANETIANQEKAIKDLIGVVEKVLEAPQKMSAQKPAEKVKVKSDFNPNDPNSIENWQKQFA